jgi:uncharacterized repeat protein (TIGR03803 family)
LGISVVATANPTLAAASTIYVFLGKSDGGNPEAGVIIGRDGVLYGTADIGGNATDSGTVYSFTPPTASGGTWTRTTLARLAGGAGGGYPLGLVQDADGNLYGYALDFGAGGYGTVFRLGKPAAPGRAWRFETIYAFQGGNDGALPSGLALQSDGTLIGVTDRGGQGNCLDPYEGTQVGCGTVFQLTPPTQAKGPWTETILYSFAGGSDGVIPVGPPLNVGGALLGVTTQGGGGPCTDGSGNPSGCGTVYKLTPGGAGTWVESVPYAFQGGAQGSVPLGGLAVDRSGALYGATAEGGSTAVDSYGDGIVYRLAPAPGSGVIFQVIHTFEGPADGRSPEGGVAVTPGGTVFGTTYLGPQGYFGSVYRLVPPESGSSSWTESILAKFPSPGGTYPSGQIALQSGGKIYGVTLFGGRFNQGTLYEVTLP